MSIEDECKRYYYVNKLLEIKNFIVKTDQWKWEKMIERFLLVEFQKDLNFIHFDEEFINRELEWLDLPPKINNVCKKKIIFLLKRFSSDKNIAKNIKLKIQRNFSITYNFGGEKISYIYEFDTGRKEKLLELSDETGVAIMIMRYASLASNGQQWAHSTKFYKFFKDNYDVGVEGFASPLNSRMMLLDSYFCSLFPDVDEKFGSLCKFGEAYFENISIMCNPPFIGSLINESVNFAIKNLEDAKKNNYKVRYIFTFPIFETKNYFKTLNESEFLVLQFYLEAKKHSYENLKGDLKLFSLDTHFYILSYGYKDNIDNMEEEVKKLFSK